MNIGERRIWGFHHHTQYWCNSSNHILEYFYHNFVIDKGPAIRKPGGGDVFFGKKYFVFTFGEKKYFVFHVGEKKYFVFHFGEKK